MLAYSDWRRRKRWRAVRGKVARMWEREPVTRNWGVPVLSHTRPEEGRGGEEVKQSGEM